MTGRGYPTQSAASNTDVSPAGPPESAVASDATGVADSPGMRAPPLAYSKIPHVGQR